MTATACIIPYYFDGSQERKNNLQACLSQVMGQGFDDIVVVEAGVGVGRAQGGYRHLFAKSGNLFNAGRYRNFGACNTDAELLLFLDADMLLWHHWLRDCITIAKKNKAILPYDHIWKVDQEESVAMRNRPLETMPGITHRCGEYVPPGGALWIWKDHFVEIGGYDEDFVGWGGEDSEILLRAGNVGRIPNWPLIHLWHPTSNMANRVKNQKLYMKKARALKAR